MDYLGLLIHAASLLRRYENTIIRHDVDPLFAALQRELTAAAKPSLLGADRARIAKVLQEVFAKLEARAGHSLAMVAENHTRKVDAAVDQRKPPTAAQADTLPAGVAVDVSGQPLPSQQSRAEVIIKNDAFDGATWGRWVQIQQERTARDTAKHIELSRIAKETPEQLRDRLAKYVTRPAQIRARALTRTFSLNLSNALSWEQAEADPRVKGYRLLVVLDSRTSVICLKHASEHKFYTFEPDSPRPPFHFNCRTIIYPVVVGRETEKPPEGNEWFNKQSEATQDEVLGSERAAMWRAGEVSLSELVTQDNRVYDLAELRGVSGSVGRTVDIYRP